MGESVSGIRESFYHDIIFDYQCKYDKREKSFLYRAFWAESVSGLLKRLDRSLSEHLTGHGGETSHPLEKYMAPACPDSRSGSWDYPWHLAKQSIKPSDENRMKEQLAAAMKENPSWAMEQLIKDVPEKGRKERRDFWEELWLRDAAYKAGLITDTECYLWLVEYLAVRDIYYKDNSVPNAHLWLKRLLYTIGVAGIRNPGNAAEYAQNSKSAANAENTGNPRNRQNVRDSEDLNVKVNVEKKLAEAAELIRQERDAGKTEIADQLHNLKRSVKRNGVTIRKEDYLPWLIAHLERMAVHIKIKTWLQDSGYSLGGRDREGKSAREPRKQDFSLRLFEAYCDSRDGYEFFRKGLVSPESSGDWHMDSQGFCRLDLSQADELRERLEQSQKRYLYIPLAVHPGSGCIFFLAGKENYRETYRKAGKEQNEAFRKAESCCCFDYLRLDEGYMGQFPGDMSEAFRLQPVFHKNQGRSCREVFEEFKQYCLTGTDRSDETDETDSPHQAIKILNEEAPDGIPDTFLWAFENLEEMEASKEAVDSFFRAREICP